MNQTEIEKQARKTGKAIAAWSFWRSPLGRYLFGTPGSNRRFEQKIRDEGYVEFGDYFDVWAMMLALGAFGFFPTMLFFSALLDLARPYGLGPTEDLTMAAVGALIGFPLFSRALRRIPHLFILKRLEREQRVPYATPVSLPTTRRAQCPRCRAQYLEEPGKLIKCSCGATLRIPTAA